MQCIYSPSNKQLIHNLFLNCFFFSLDVAGDIIMKDEEAYEEKLRQQEEEAEKVKKLNQDFLAFLKTQLYCNGRAV